MTCGVTGLLHAPNAEMQEDATVLIGGNYMNKENLPNKNIWYYNSYNYYLNITFLSRLELAYICTLVKGIPNTSYWPEQTWNKFVNQDRHAAARFLLMRENDFFAYMPAIVIGVNDPTTGTGGDYTKPNVEGSGNGHFNKWYIAASKHINTKWGEFGGHIGYVYNKRKPYPLNGPTLGINFRPDAIKGLNAIIEYDSKTVNIGAIYNWKNHFNLLFELQNFKYISAGLCLQLNLKNTKKIK